VSGSPKKSFDDELVTTRLANEKVAIRSQRTALATAEELERSGSSICNRQQL
jgi:hypothetical protein